MASAENIADFLMGNLTFRKPREGTRELHREIGTGTSLAILSL